MTDSMLPVNKKNLEKIVESLLGKKKKTIKEMPRYIAPPIKNTESLKREFYNRVDDYKTMLDGVEYAVEHALVLANYGLMIGSTAYLAAKKKFPEAVALVASIAIGSLAMMAVVERINDKKMENYQKRLLSEAKYIGSGITPRRYNY